MDTKAYISVFCVNDPAKAGPSLLVIEDLTANDQRKKCAGMHMGRAET